MGSGKKAIKKSEAAGSAKQKILAVRADRLAEKIALRPQVAPVKCDECGEPMRDDVTFRGGAYFVDRVCPNGHVDIDEEGGR
jgi:hypothetical protein